MRDGIHLNTEIYVPENMQKPLPFLITRTPYGLRHDKNGFHISLSTSYRELVEDGYIFVFQDIRGRFKSEGKFVMLRPPHKKDDPNAIDEGTDTFDTISWLLKNIPGNNGRAGILGISYGGWLTVMAIIEPHPAVRAVSPQASPANMFIGDDFLHNGAFRLSPSFGYVALMETSNIVTPFRFDIYDTFEWYLELGALSNVNKKYFHGKMPTWNNFMSHPTYDEYWKRQQVSQYLKKVSVPTLNVAGWWDAEDFYGPMKIYETLEKYDTDNKNYLVVGPWRHGGWARSSGKKLGKIDFGSNTGVYFRKNVQSRWFAYFLKDKGNLNLPEALAFQTGINEWKSYDKWPPEKNIIEQKLYLHSNRKLSFNPPGENEKYEFDSYISDPACPVPYTKRPIKGFWQGAQALWKVEDQRFVHLRPDVLSWKTDVLKKDITISGRIIAHLFASSSGTDCDWVVKLIDVYSEDYPEKEMRGYQLMIADEVLRAKFRNSFENPEPLTPGKITEFVIDLNSRNHCFRKGHRIMVQIQSSWFPLIDRNPQKFVNIPEAKEKDYQKATQRIFHSKQFPSYLKLPVVKEIE
ncbi:X-Pro dipeptidyl-peptidase [candidate division KSB1 bacterium]|nr:MAG: X-Pro dipeptidyl-peptidase [candidate division KSB1 bacterium]